MIVEYKMHRSKQGNKIIPLFIEDGGYYVDGNKLVGYTINDGSYIPETLIVLDKAALITKLTNIGYTVRGDNDERRSATAEEIEAEVDTFISKYS